MDNLTYRYYIKCENCGFFSEITDENVPYCYNCTKKFSNSFSLWKSKFGNEKTIDEYKKMVCIPFIEREVKSVVQINNNKTEIINPNSEQKIRREYIKSGISLDSGGFYEWDLRQLGKYLLYMIILFGIIYLLIILL